MNRSASRNSASSRGGSTSPGVARARALLVAMLAIAVTLSTAIAFFAPRAADASGPPPRTTLPAIERQVMCVTCKIPLNVAESAQANRERVYIRGLIGEGKTAAEIKDALVAQYGPAVLALPSDHGFDLAVYLVPIVVVAVVLLLLALALPRWRRRTPQGAALADPAPRLSPGDASRLEQDLARFDR
jgi:cytochrome c-type biogenesis protein CcmH